MENGAKNKAILLSPWGTTGQAAADFLPDYFRAALLLSGHIQANRASLSFQQGWAADMYAPTHTHPQLTHLMPN